MLHTDISCRTSMAFEIFQLLLMNYFVIAINLETYLCEQFITENTIYTLNRSIFQRKYNERYDNQLNFL